MNERLLEPNFLTHPSRLSNKKQLQFNRLLGGVKANLDPLMDLYCFLLFDC